MKPFFSNKKEDSLIEKVLDVFLKNGIKTITMDNVAVLLHVSKKTLYKYVKNRPELVSKAFSCLIWKDQLKIRAIVNKGLNAIEENQEIAEYTILTLSKMNPKVHFDMYNYYPKAGQIFDDYKTTFLTDLVIENIRKGKKEGLYLSEVNEHVMSKMYCNNFDMCFNSNFSPSNQFNFTDFYLTYLMHHMRGMCTPKGIELIEKHFAAH